MRYQHIALIVFVSLLVNLSIIAALAAIGRSSLLALLLPEQSPVEFNKTVTASPEAQSDQTVPKVVEQVNKSVVSVVVTKDVPIYEEYYEEYNPWGLWGGFGNFRVPQVREKGTEEREVGGGSGFIVSGDGHIVTNRHVVSDETARYSILTNDGVSYEVDVLARDPVLDIAVLKISDLKEGEELPYLKFGNSETLQLGETVIAIGNALGEFRNSVSVGVVSGLARSITASDMSGNTEQLDQVIQTDAAINPGNSGGPLLNLKGEVVGVNVATSRGADNIGFALPAHLVTGVVTSVRETGQIVRPFLGVRYVMISDRIKELNKLNVAYGALIVRGETREELAVMPGSPADIAGLEENDIILAIDGVELRESDLSTILRTKQPGDSISLRLLKDGKEETVEVVLSEAES